MSNAIEFRKVVKSYANFQLGPLNLNVPQGAIYGLIGPNGAGKTTAIDLIFGMGCSEGGEIRVMGFDHRRDEVALKQCAAYVGPDLNFQIWVTVAKAVRFVRGFYPGWDDAYCAELMKSLQLNSGDIIRTLSFGGRTKLSLLLALARRPQVLILDEPTTGLDAVSKQQVFSELLKVVEDGQHTVLISSHGLTDIERFADHIGMIKEGKLLFEGQTDTIVERYRFVDFFMDKEIPIDNRQGLRILKHCDNRYHALLDEESFARDWLQKNGVRDLTATRLTLEDLFVALAK